MKIKITNKIIAREILVFFGSLIVLLLLYCIPLTKNTYYSSSIASYANKQNTLYGQLDKLPTNYTWILYENAKRAMTKTTAIDWFDNKKTSKSEIEPFNDFQEQLKNEQYRGGIATLIHETIDENKVAKSIGYSSTVSIQISQINDDILKLTENINSASIKILSEADIWHYMMVCCLIVILIAYGLRYSVISILWAINTIKNDTTSQQNTEPM